jgi:hypothetical protein
MLRNMEKAMLDLSKPVQTQDGYPVRIICTDATPDYPIVGVVNHPRGKVVRCWPNHGMVGGCNLINVPPPEVHSWLNVYQTFIPCEWSTQEQANKNVIHDCWLCRLKITRVDGVVTKVEIV